MMPASAKALAGAIADLYTRYPAAPAHGSYAVQEVIPNDWGTIPKDLKPLYDELWMAMRPVREHRVQIDAAAFAAACQRAGLWPSWPTVPLSMDQLCMHWCRYAAMEQARLAPEGDAKS